MRLKGFDRDFNTAIFDFDGTLADSMWMWKDIDIEYMDSFGLKYDAAACRKIGGMSVEECAKYFRDVLHIPRSIEEMRADWIRMSFEKYRSEVELKPHARELLELFRASGVRMGVATSNAIEMVSVCMDSNQISGYFDAVVTCSDVGKGKPAPDVYLHAASRLGADPAGCLVFEDIPEGIMAGRAAGMGTVAVYDRNSAELDDQKRSLADLYIYDFGELL